MRPDFLSLMVFPGALALHIPTLAPGFLWDGRDFATLCGIFQTRSEVQPWSPVYRLVEKSP